MPPDSKNTFSYPFSAIKLAAAVPLRSSPMYIIISLFALFLNLKSSGIILSLPILAAG